MEKQLHSFSLKRVPKCVWQVRADGIENSACSTLKRARIQESTRHNSGTLRTVRIAAFDERYQIRDPNQSLTTWSV